MINIVSINLHTFFERSVHYIIACIIISEMYRHPDRERVPGTHRGAEGHIQLLSMITSKGWTLHVEIVNVK